MNKQVEKTVELMQKGWIFQTTKCVRLNNNIYQIVVMEKDGKKIFINKNGGQGGMAVAVAKQSI